MQSTSPSIIVYRNPFEEMFWSGQLLFIIVGAGMFVLILAMCMTLITNAKWPTYTKKYKWAVRLAFLISAGVGVICSILYYQIFN